MNGSEEHTTYAPVEQPKVEIQGTKSRLPSGELPGTGNIDKVRDILFGTQMRDYEKRFTRLEERLVKECANLRDDTRKRLDSLETYLKQEVESLSERIKSEQAERDEAVKELVRDRKDTIQSIEKRIAQFDEQTTQSQRELRQQILDQSKNLYDEIGQKYTEILTILEREAQHLHTDKTDRATLAAMFAELAMRLNAEQ